jgi:hypothetical protein
LAADAAPSLTFAAPADADSAPFASVPAPVAG